MPVPILICDDSRMARRQLSRALPPAWAVDVNFASNGVEALVAVREQRPALMFLDLTMPVLDGYGVLQALADEPHRPSVIVVSADIQPDAQRRVQALGAQEFMTKPIDRDRLAEVLARLGLHPGVGDEPAVARLPSSPAVGTDALDCYREIANVAMGQAGNLLARLLDVFVILPVPNVNLLEVGELAMALTAVQADASCSAVCQGYTGAGIAGEALLIFNDTSFAAMGRLMKYPGEVDAGTELELLLDTANVLIGACLQGIADQLNVRFSQGHPSVLGRHRRIDELIAINGKRWNKALAIEIHFTIEAHDIDCDLLLLFTEESIATLNEQLGHLLDD